jgi:hypothetical protein
MGCVIELGSFRICRSCARFPNHVSDHPVAIHTWPAPLQRNIIEGEESGTPLILLSPPCTPEPWTRIPFMFVKKKKKSVSCVDDIRRSLMLGARKYTRNAAQNLARR